MLQRLDCENNRLSKLELSGCAGLKALYCYDNRISFLDISSASCLKRAVNKGKQTSNKTWIKYDYKHNILKVDKSTAVSTSGKPVIKTQPKSASIKAGRKVTFKVKAAGEALKYQWYVMKKGTSKWVKINNATSASYKFSVKKKLSGYKYRCKITNTAGTTTSKAVKLTVK